MIMNANLSAPIEVQSLAGHYWNRRLVAVLKRLWVAYRNWRIEQQAIDQLRSMSDAQLKDIGLVRSRIEIAVRSGVNPGQGRGLAHF